MNIIYVLLPLPLASGAYAYKIPNGENPPKGMFISVPLGNRSVIGIVWEKTDDKQINPNKIKSAGEIYYSLPVMPNDIIK